MSGSAATSDLVKLALAVLQTGVARNAQRSIKLLVRVALLQTVAALCVIAALGCALAALLIYARPILGAGGALLAGAGAFAVIALAALVFLMFVAYRGFSVILFAPIAALGAVLLTDPGAVPAAFTGLFMDKMVGFAKLYFPVFLLGATNAYLFKKTGKLAPCVLLHMIYNAVVLS